jgi:ribonuclease P protein component
MSTSPTSSPQPARFPRAEHLKRQSDIKRTFKNGKTAACYGAKLFAFKREDGALNTRIAFTFQRKYGNAVERNRAKRLGREAYRALRQDLKPGYDLVWLLFVPANADEKKKMTCAKRLAQFRTLCSRAGLLREEQNEV